MKIFHEKIEDEHWIDQVLTDKDLRLLQEGQMLHKSFGFNGMVYNLGINISQEESEDEEECWPEEDF